VGALRKEQDAARTILISFDSGTLESVRKLDASIMTGLLVEELQPDSVKAAVDIGARQLCPRFSSVTAELVAQAHRSDLHVATWTVNDAEDMRKVISTGVDGVMTDFPDRLEAILEP
jgi:glycerophosphoryl diester phosphodiesterase